MVAANGGSAGKGLLALRRCAFVSGLALLAASCGGSSGKSSDSQNTGESLEDPIIPLVGPTGRYSMTPEEANASGGLNPPPLMPTQAVNNQNQYLRLECPFDVLLDSVVGDDPLLAPFSFLNGTVNITDQAGNHVPCIVLVDGRDRTGRDRSGDAGFPTDLNASGRDLNLGSGTLLFVADDGDDDLSTVAAFGGSTTDSDFRADTTDITQIRLTVRELNGFEIDAFYTVTVNDGLSGGDVFEPTVFDVVAETPNPEAPLDGSQADYRSRFIVRFSEPVVPTSVGKSTVLDRPPFDGNMPLLATPPNPPQPPLPNTYLTATLNSNNSPLFIPCDVNPINSNNLATYVITPLIDLPERATLTLHVVDASANQDPVTGTPAGPIDLAGNFHQPGGDDITEFAIGPGRGLVNVPVSPEAIYWLPVQRRGLGVWDLNGLGFNTNEPGKNAERRASAALVTRPYQKQGANCPITNLDLTRGIALRAHPPGAPHNRFMWKTGLGSFTYGPGDPNTPDWEDPADNGNPGTPFPGVNEMSSGYEMPCRNHKGEVLLTGEQFGEVGLVLDAIVGEFLDIAIFDTQSIFNGAGLHVSFYWGAGIDSNSINEAPAPNPPPLRYWLGLNPVDILIDQTNPGGRARLIEGEEVWAGDKSFDQQVLGIGPGGACSGPTPWAVSRRSYQFLHPNPNPELPDLPPFHYDMGLGGPLPVYPRVFTGRGLGPNPQTGTTLLRYSSRQQIGNYLYVTDAESEQVHALNSNTMQIIDSIPLPDPNGLAIAPEARFLYVSNTGDNSVSVIGADPTFPDFHQEVARIDVGSFPSALAAQPDGEDVFVCNQADDSISVISSGDLTVRKTIDTLIANPIDVVLSPRQNGFGFATGIYFGYVANFGASQVLVYESGPDGPQGIGCDNILGSLPTEGNENIEFIEPRGLCYSPYFNDAGTLASGCFVAHRTDRGAGVVTRIEFTHQVLPGPLPCTPPPGLFFIPPGFNDRNFEITGQWGTTEESALIGNNPSSVVLADFSRELLELVPSLSPSLADRGTAPFGGHNSRHQVRILPPTDPRSFFAPTVEPDRMYVGFEDTGFLQVLDPQNVGVTLDVTAEGMDGIGTRKLVTYFSQ